MEEIMNSVDRGVSYINSAVIQGGPTDNEGGRIGRILVADDDPTIREMMVNYFEESNLLADVAASRYEVHRYLAAVEPCLIVLDIALGGCDGLDVLREIRIRSDVPVILVTGQRLNEIDRVVGLELGADDYITKPFSLRELLARIRAVLRRHEMGRAGRLRDLKPGGYHFSGWKLECRNRCLLDPDGNQVALTNGEYDLLIAFLDAPQRTLTREELLQASRIHDDVFDRSIDVQVLRLRRKLEANPSAPCIIQTQRGVGYILAVPAERF
jgi:DNA-binding response OmpR family regulator